VHIRNKTTVGERLASAALAIGSYNLSRAHYLRVPLSAVSGARSGATPTAWNGPVPMTITLPTVAGVTAGEVGKATLVVHYSAGGGVVATGLEFVSLEWNNQTTNVADYNFEVLVGPPPSYLSRQLTAWNGTWVVVPATVSGTSNGAVTLTLPTATTEGAEVVGLRYAWAETPPGQQLYGAGLPAMPFIATCSGGSCTLVPPGLVPNVLPPPPGPSPPSPPVPPAPPAPPSTACRFENNTKIEHATVMATYRVGFLDQDACCAACRGVAHGGCAAAQLMGSGSLTPPFHSDCRLYSSVGKHSKFSCEWPCARVAIVPTTTAR
jgi:hypothetical protein